tara:strand:+ start:6602 stop:7342 length:741 start_codon:yes stop_codon:yes gene_type:complete
MNYSETKPLSYSSIKEFAKSPAHFIAYQNRDKKPTSAMELGTAIHMLVLEEEKFKKEYNMCNSRRNTNIYKEELAKGKKLLNQNEWITAHKIKEAIKAHPLASELVGGADRYESEIIKEIQGVPFRGFLDIHGTNYIADLKTCKNGSPSEFQRSCYNFKYYLQAAVYSELTGIKDFWIITAETSAPYCITPYKISSAYMLKGRQELYKIIEAYKKWMEEDKCRIGGYDYLLGSESFFTLEAPNWAK